MNNQESKNTIHELFANGKGLLAMDESTGTCDKRFAALGIPQTLEMRCQYREMIATTPGLNENIGGAILYDETIRQKTKSGTPIIEVLQKAGIIPGIKVDMGAKPMAGFTEEKITEGLDTLRERLADYKNMGARFAKWRAVITISDKLPTSVNIKANMQALARYAALCQEVGIVPIVEPEVLMEGDHTLQRCYEVTMETLNILFFELYRFRIDLEGIILKPSMVLPGSQCTTNYSIEEVAEATVNCFMASVPAAVPAIAFLSGGQSPEKANAHLSAINKNYKGKLPWIVSFSFARAIQQDAMEMWKGEEANVEKAQELLYQSAKNASMARSGEYVDLITEH